jgi:CBS domain-containing protein
MQARDVMTTKVVVVNLDTPLRQVARVLLDHGISAVPVLDAEGALIGMVSEGDLVTRSESERTIRRDWWLKLLADEPPTDDARLDDPRSPTRTADNVMATPVVTVGETTDLTEVARLLAVHRIKRVPVLKDGRVVGIVSRADLLRAVAGGVSSDTPETPLPGHRGFLSELFGEYHRPTWEIAMAHDAGGPIPELAEPAATAPGFRTLESDFHSSETRHHDEVQLAAEKQRQDMAQIMIDRICPM